MKLNNKGWSLNTLLICMAVILSFLLISVFYVYKLSTTFTNDLNSTNNSSNYTNNSYSKTNTSKDDNNQNYGNDSNKANNNEITDNNTATNNTKDKYYTTKESQLRAGTIRYLKENAITVADDETININANDIISKKYVQTIKDERTNNACDGYSTVSFKDNDYVVKSYIDCDSYTSEGYGVE